MSSFSSSYKQSSRSAEQAKKLVDQAKEMFEDAIRKRADLKKLVAPEDEERRVALEQQIRAEIERSRELAKIAKELSRS